MLQTLATTQVTSPDPLTVPVPAVRVVLADATTLFRQAFACAVQAAGDVVVEAQTDDVRTTCAAVEATKPDVLIVDYMLRDTDAVSLVRELRRRRLRVRTLVLSRHSNPLFVQGALRSGVNGFALKQQGLGELKDAIHSVALGESYLAPDVKGAAAKPLDDKAESFARLSMREREILTCLLEGRSNADIARALFISPRTVDSHRNRMNRKLGVKNPLELLRLAAEAGLVE